ncbi:MAG: regulatory protein RecX [Desulfuromonadaceae bacterium]|nr:recombination regulator RecX [Geobacteraceae bacterium]
MDTESGAYAHALRLLTVRARSVADLRRRLHKKEYPQQQIDAAIARCSELNYINDPRTAHERTRSLMRNGKVGPRVRQQLFKEGFEEQDIETAIEDCRCEYDEREILAEVFTRRFDARKTDLHDPRQRRRVVGYLQRRGFSLNIILEHINERLRDLHADHE